MTTEPIVVLTRGAVVGLDAGSGAERWRHDVGAVLEPKRPIVIGDVVVVEEVLGVTALERSSGRVRWHLELVRDDERDVAVVDDLVVIGSRGEVHAWALADGHPRWSAPLQGLGYWPVAVGRPPTAS
jgi:outer membrane protein assembly factor BamB